MPNEEKPKVRDTGTMKMLAVALAILVILTVTTVLIVMLVNFWDYGSSRSTPEHDESMKLLSATVIFRHGARAPTKFDNSTDPKAFPNGKGQLTQLGIDDTFKLGQFIGDRYVRTGFLRSPMSPSEIHFLSRANSRCTHSAALVGSGMWAKNGDEDQFNPVPIYSNVENDKLFNHLLDCNIEKQRIGKKCGQPPPSQKKWAEYEGFLYECLGLHKDKVYLRDGKAYGDIDTLIQLDRHGMPTPKWFAQKKKEVYSTFEKMYSYIVGVNEFHNPGVLRVKQGTFMKTVMSQLRSQWTEFEQTGHIRKKFTAYSTQDWLILAFLHSLGCGESVLGRTVPNYNALIIIELYVRNKEPVVKLLYKDNEMKTPKEAVKYVRNCKSSPCHLEEFTSCCSEYESENPTETCAVG